MIIDDQLMERIAELSKLGPSSKEKKKLSEQLSKILEHMKLMDEINVDGLNSIFHSCVEKPELREDRVEKSNPKALMDNAPDSYKNYFSVPQIMVEEEF